MKYISEDTMDNQKIPIEDYKEKNVHHEQNGISTLFQLDFSKNPPFQRWNQHLPSFKNQNLEILHLENFCTAEKNHADIVSTVGNFPIQF